jgi:hypothetical protein
MGSKDAASLPEKVADLEEQIGSLATRGVSLSSNVDSDFKSGAPSHAESLKARLEAMGKQLGEMRRSTSALEQELLGHATTIHTSKARPALAGHVEFVQKEVDNLKHRMDTLDESL